MNNDITKIPHEIHLTVTHDDGVDLTQFMHICEQLEVKPIVLDLYTKDGYVIKDIMTSSVFVGTTYDATMHMLRLRGSLMYLGYRVIRTKLETVPWHPLVPTLSNNKTHLSNCYFESHIELLVASDVNTSIKLKQICQQFDVHMSKNFFKKVDDNVYTLMLTYRDDRGTIESFKERVQEIRQHLIDSTFSLSDREIIEYCLHDSNVAHDNEWVNKQNMN